ncbi:Pre-mRNA splicing factor CLF1 [Pleurostoma richardsiae]|uniref:Pre-mRNA splicing factor CLF1 n=1 Tax=Pleurostoma richardsiae TaxID=41990 RepID=A0AA38S7K7_9PEZI|nr:Pre-mRNA splicing factor CLF1 [Pleurostoma richardsiae]
MPLPQPEVPLDDICSVIFNNTLYTYSSEAFQSLTLTQGAEWETLPQGESVTGGVCVGSTPGDSNNAGFWVVGGKGESADYKGLQKFTYSTGKWESISPVVAVTQDRLWHGAAYLNASDSILMYAGSQDGSENPSTQTFTIGASAPFGVTSYQSIAPPTVNPMLLPWSQSQAVLIGGSTTNTKVMLFDPATSWQDSGASLLEPLQKDTTAVKAVIVKGDDGCMNLYTFDMTQSPNEVNRTVLINGQGAPVASSAPITGDSSSDSASRRRSERVQRRALTLSDWPQYNDTMAPSATRTNYAVAEDPNGLVVIAGGNDDDVLCMFSGRQNSWQNATAKLVGQKELTIQGLSSSSSLPATATSTASVVSSTSAAPSQTTTAAAATSQSSKSNTNTILGAVLGSILGVAFLLALLYFCIRRQRQRRNHLEAGHLRRASGASSPEKDGLGFAADSLPQIKGSVFRGHDRDDSHGSFSSIAILMGRVGQKNETPRGVGRKVSNGTKRSSSSSLFNKHFKSTISKPIPQMVENVGPVRSEPEIREEKGVSFAAGTADPKPTPRTNVIDREDSTRRSSGWNRYWSGGSALNILGMNGSKRTTVESDQSSHYSSQPHRITQDSATVPPLHVEGKPRFSRVNSGSPTVDQYNSRLKDGMAGQIERPSSGVSALSGYSSGIPASVHDTWDPTAFNSKPWGADRAPSSAYSSLYTTPLVPPSANTRAAPTRGGVPSGISQQPQLAMAATSSDMSWLNLGENGR